MIHYFDIEGIIKNVPTKSEVEAALGQKVITWKCNINSGDELLRVCDGHSLMGRGYYILEGENEVELKQNAEIIKKMFQ